LHRPQRAGRWNEFAARTLRGDIERAGVEATTPEGVIDFHALRMTGISWEWNATKDVKRTQMWARHASVDLTMNTYNRAHHLSDNDRLDALMAEVGPGMAAAMGVGTPSPLLTGFLQRRPLVPGNATQHPNGGNSGPDVETPKNGRKSLNIRETEGWAEPESNRRHMDFQSIALPTELPAR
jgi:hypothetical protein